MGLFDFFKKKQEIDIHSLQQQMYQNIFNNLKDELPEGWKEFILYVGVTEGTCSSRIFILKDNNEYVDAWDVWGNDLSKKIYRFIYNEVYNVIDKLEQKHKWKILLMTVDNQGHLSADYDYADKVNNDELMNYLIKYEKDLIKKYIS